MQRACRLNSGTWKRKSHGCPKRSACRVLTAGTAPMQEVEYVKQEAKLVYLLECLQKTAPPVLIFAEKQTDVDDVHEYLMSKDVDAVAVHGQKTQEERAEAIDRFKVCNVLNKCLEEGKCYVYESVATLPWLL